VIGLPIDSYLPEITTALARARAVVVVAQPGAGKTTRVPPALVGDGPVILLQPRRVAARAVVRRIAEERGWTIGREVGWHIRFERRFGADTRLLSATEGILTARLQQDPLLSDFRTIVIDEFHERSIYADVAIALARQAWLARADLRIVVMSATIDAQAVAAFLGGCPVVDVPGSLHPVRVTYAPGRSAAEASIDLLDATAGDVLAFLPGMFEIRQTIADIGARLARRQTDLAVDLIPLHGSLPANEQDDALRPGAAGRRRIVVATNVAETSVTVPGVTAVVDSGLQKVARYDADRAIDSLEIERITQDAADQRAGRAGRTAPGTVCRLWDAHDRLRPHRDAEIHRVDLSSTVLDIAAWGGDARTVEWFEPPRADALESAMALLDRLGAMKDGALTALGRELQRLPLHPRLGRILLAGGGARPLAQACALLSERHYVQPRLQSTSSDLLSALDGWASVPPHVQRVAREIEETAAAVLGGDAARTVSEADFLRAILAGYPDRVAERREPGSARVKLATGSGAVVAPESGVRDGQFLVAVDVMSRGLDWARRRPVLDMPGRHRARASRAGVGPRPVREDDSARIRIASRVDREWLQATAIETVHRFDESTGTVHASLIERYDALMLSDTPTPVDPEEAATLLAKAWLERGPREGDLLMTRRLRFAGRDVNLAEAVRRAAYGARSLDDVQLARGLDPDVVRALDREAPEILAVPSGRAAKLDYRDDGSVAASVKLQELFGLAETPRIGARREPVLLALLAPNGRPVQMTRDLRSFWERTYPEVRKELRGRYPRHPWPEDPWNATPTARTVRPRRP
jgi:ATP-dependent helicase HrpB